MIHKFCFFLLGVFLFTSCVTNRDTRYLQKTKEVYSKGDFAEYRLQKSDEVSVVVYSLNPEVTNLFTTSGGAQSAVSAYRIFDDGTIDLPFVHGIKLEGLTLREAEIEVKQKLSQYIKDDFSVKVNMSDKCFYVIGEQSGKYSYYKEKLNIFEAVALAGDFKTNVDKRNIRILRKKPNGEDEIIKFDLRSKSIVDSKYYYIEPNDVIILNRSKRNFYQITSFTGFVGMVTSTFSFVLIVLQYSK